MVTASAKMIMIMTMEIIPRKVSIMMAEMMLETTSHSGTAIGTEMETSTAKTVIIMIMIMIMEMNS